jgi:hypothetical protein
LERIEKKGVRLVFSGGLVIAPKHLPIAYSTPPLPETPISHIPFLMVVDFLVALIPETFLEPAGAIVGRPSKNHEAINDDGPLVCGLIFSRDTYRLARVQPTAVLMALKRRGNMVNER